MAYLRKERRLRHTGDGQQGQVTSALFCSVIKEVSCELLMNWLITNIAMPRYIYCKSYLANDDDESTLPLCLFVVYCWQQFVLKIRDMCHINI